MLATSLLCEVSGFHHSSANAYLHLSTWVSVSPACLLHYLEPRRYFACPSVINSSRDTTQWPIQLLILDRCLNISSLCSLICVAAGFVSSCYTQYFRSILLCALLSFLSKYFVSRRVSEACVWTGRIQWLCTFLFRAGGRLLFMILPCLPKVLGSTSAQARFVLSWAASVLRTCHLSMCSSTFSLVWFMMVISYPANFIFIIHTFRFLDYSFSVILDCI